MRELHTCLVSTRVSGHFLVKNCPIGAEYSTHSAGIALAYILANFKQAQPEGSMCRWSNRVTMRKENRNPQRSGNRKRQSNHATRLSDWLVGVAILIVVVLGYLVMQTQKRLETVQSELHRVSGNAVQAGVMAQTLRSPETVPSFYLRFLGVLLIEPSLPAGPPFQEHRTRHRSFADSQPPDPAISPGWLGPVPVLYAESTVRWAASCCLRIDLGL